MNDKVILTTPTHNPVNGYMPASEEQQRECTYRKVEFLVNTKPLYNRGKRVYHIDWGATTQISLDITDKEGLSDIKRDGDGNIMQYTREGAITALLPL